MTTPLYYLTLDEMAALLRVTRATLRKMIYRGEIPIIKVGRQIRIHIDVLKTFEISGAEELASQKAIYGERIKKMHAVQPNMLKHRARLAAEGGKTDEQD